jgi:hypothetical protein
MANLTLAREESCEVWLWVAVINEAAVRRFFPHENPLGTHIYSGFGWPEIVGIAKDAATLPAYRATRVDPAMTLRHE